MERIIPNLRFRTWPGLLWIFGWGMVWMPAAIWVESGYPRDRWPRLLLITIPALASYVVVWIAISRLPVRRLRLGERLRAGPAGHFAPPDIAVIRIACDPAEDFDDAVPPGSACLLTVDRVRGRPIQVLVTGNDAAHVRDWAEDKGILVEDPDGRATRGPMT